MTYQPGKPLPGDLLSDSQGDIKDNFTVANTVMSIDHYPFADLTTNAGRHKDIHIVKRVGNPATVAGTQILFTKDYTPNTSPASPADTQLFTMTGAGGLSQLTGNNSANEGWCWMGGILLQWGTVTIGGSSSHVTGTVTFQSRSAGSTIPFPNNIFAINATLTIASSSTTTASNTIAIRSKSITNFLWVYNSSSSSGSADHPQFYWTAIGN